MQQKLRQSPARYTVAVGSGKGGVGKSTVSLNLALALAADGAAVGILDADLYGPNIPLMVGLSRSAWSTGWTIASREQAPLPPIERYGLKIMSAGFIIAEDQPMGVSGATVRMLLTQLLTQVAWGATLDAIATAADVSPKTVSAAFGSKRGLLAALVSPPSFGQRFQELRGELVSAPDPRRRVELVARLTRQADDTLTPEFDLLRGASAVAPEVAEVAQQVGARRQNQTYLIAYLVERRVLRSGLSPEEATDTLWALTGYDLYRALVGECGWAPERYETWLAGVLIQRLLTP